MTDCWPIVWVVAATVSKDEHEILLISVFYTAPLPIQHTLPSIFYLDDFIKAKGMKIVSQISK